MNCTRGMVGCDVCAELTRRLERLLHVGIATGRWREFDETRALLERHYSGGAKEDDTGEVER